MATYSSILHLENPRDRGAWRATAHGVAESDTTEQARMLLASFPRLSLMLFMCPYSACFLMNN